MQGNYSIRKLQGKICILKELQGLFETTASLVLGERIFKFANKMKAYTGQKLATITTRARL